MITNPTKELGGLDAYVSARYFAYVQYRADGLEE